jgi:hypothetical protein
MTASSGLSACIITTQNIENFLEDQHHKTITIPVAPLHKSYHAKIGLIVIVKMVVSQDYLSVVPIFLVIVTPVVVACVPRNRRQSLEISSTETFFTRAISVAISVRCARYWFQRLPIRDLSGSRSQRSQFSLNGLATKFLAQSLPVQALPGRSGRGAPWIDPEGQADQNRGLQSDAPDIGIETWSKSPRI